MNDEQLIELVGNYSVLYDLSHPKYMDTNFKLDIWNNIGKEMKVDGSSCKARWNNIRDNYRKSLKKAAIRSAQSAKKIKLYKYSEQLRFLNKYFDEKEIKGNIEGQKDEECNHDDDDAQQEDEEENRDDPGEPTLLGLNDDLQSQPSPSSKRKNTFELLGKSAARKVAPEQTASAQLMEYLTSKNENETAVTLSQHPVDAFLAGIAPTLKSFTPYYLNLAKSEIFASVQKFELKILMEQHILYEKRSNSNCLHNMTPHSEHDTTSLSSASTPLLSPAPLCQEHTTTSRDEHQSSAPCHGNYCRFHVCTLCHLENH